MSSEATKEAIMNTALTMFAEKGYAAVSMRDISGAVGIRASTIYYYFKSKQDIFDALIEMVDQISEKLKDGFAQALGLSKKVKCADFVKVGKLFVTGYLNNEKIGTVLHMLENERFHDTKADEAWKKMLFTDPIRNAKEVFEALHKRDFIKDKDSERLAVEYHGIITLGYFTDDLDAMEKSLRAFYKRVFE
ncbi:MAG: TetR/AcrR family transcriptional regulator [Clostridiales bacterium]|nr:TetR/AcrR family transcriptional regulator [Clostridiales bacterium]